MDSRQLRQDEDVVSMDDRYCLFVLDARRRHFADATIGVN